MKISLNTIRWYGYSDIVDLPLDDLLTKIGEQIGAVEEVVELGPKYDGIIVAKVVSCEKHPNADKLNICKIDDGGVDKNAERDNNGLVQVVCGAPNVAAGQTVAWLPPGTTVPSTVDSDAFVLEAREIRGEVSNGMLASPKELDISDSHEGILEIKEEDVGLQLMVPGTEFKNLYGLDDVIIDIENKMFTHRPDCFGMLGVAREIAGVQSQEFVSPDWYKESLSVDKAGDLPLKVGVECPELVPRFMAVTLSNVKVGPSPIWLQSFLTRLGAKSINNIVDMTNYMMLLTGQPTHAYDYDKVAKYSGEVPAIIARQAVKGDKVKLLNGKEYEFESPAVVIATDKQAIGLGGIMGGSDTEVDDSTTSVIIECATFDMYNIRKTSMKYGLFTDAVTRFTKGQSAHQNDKVIAKLTSDIIENAGGKRASDYYDVSMRLKDNPTVDVGVDFINERLGSELSAVDMQNLLHNVEFEVNVGDNQLSVKAPFWRTDIKISEDVVEEVGRLYGYDKLPVVLPIRQVNPAERSPVMELSSKVRRILAAAGANEVLNYSFVHGDLLKNVNQDKELAYELSNAISPDLQYFRLSLLPSLLDKVHANIKAGHDQFAIFEIGKAHMVDYLGEDQLPKEDLRLSFVFAADDKTTKANYQGAAYYQSRTYLQHLATSLGFSVRLVPLVEHTELNSMLEQMTRPFEPKRTAVALNKDNKVIGVVGEFNASSRRKLKLPSFVSGFELDMNEILASVNDQPYQPISRFPSTEQDITISVANDINYAQVFDTLYAPLNAAETEHGYISSLTLIDIYQPSGGDSKNYTFRVKLTHPGRTLVTEEVNALLNNVADNAKVQLNAERV